LLISGFEKELFLVLLWRVVFLLIFSLACGFLCDFLGVVYIFFIVVMLIFVDCWVFLGMG